MSASIGQPPAIVAAILFLAFFAQAIKEIGIPSLGLTQSLLVYAGYQFSAGGFLIGGGIVLSTILGSLSGACLVFCLAKYKGNRLLAILNRYMIISPDAVEKARKKISAHSFLTVTIGRSIPGLIVPTSLITGSLSMPMGKFLTGIIIQLILWIILLTTLGGTISHYLSRLGFNPANFLVLLGALIAIGILASILYHKNKSIPIRQAKEDEQ
jgi:membrane protein DedA with SNARE-associated domain